MKTLKHNLFLALITSLLFTACSDKKTEGLFIKNGQQIALIGGNLGSRMIEYGYFETAFQQSFPDKQVVIRNMCDPGDTPGLRPQPGRETGWAFPGAENFQTLLAENTDSEGHFEYPDEWLTRLQSELIIGFFGGVESFSGKEGLENFKGELEAFILHTHKQKYNGKDTARLVLVSPIAMEDLSDRQDVPAGLEANENLAMYTTAMEQISAKHNVPFVNLFGKSKEWYKQGQHTIDGLQLNEKGYQKLTDEVMAQLFGLSYKAEEETDQLVRTAVLEKNWYWLKDYKIPNGVHAYGRRYEPFGPDNYPEEIMKTRQMTVIRDSAIWDALKGEIKDLETADKNTYKLSEVSTNYDLENNSVEYLYGDDALAKFTLPEGYKIELFASEEDFPDLANPVQMSFDGKGRLWVSVMPTYPAYKPGDPRPNDKILIFEDTDSDGKADKQSIFAENLHLPLGFELAEEGVYVSQAPHLKILKDLDGDDKADEEVILMSGFDDHDTHHAISAFCADPSGAIYMGEGVFLHSNVETAYGPVRASGAGFMRYNPNKHHLEKTAQIGIPNPWGIMFDDWGQNFYAETSSPVMAWMMPATGKPKYGRYGVKSANLIEKEHMVRPTSGIEIIYSRHFPDEVQGDYLINNTIGFLGTKQHTLNEDGTGYKSAHRQDLLRSSDPNFRPVDLEIAPDGSLYIIDWHNVLVGHMQHNARDPLRDHMHGRIYRITYPSRPLVTPAKIDGATIQELLENLKLPEYRSRYRTRRELRGRNKDEVLAGIKIWIAGLDKKEERYEHHLLEALWVSWGLNQVDKDLLNALLASDDYRVRSAAVRVVRYNGHQLDNQVELLKTAAADEHGRVRLEAITAASWLDKEQGLEILSIAGEHPLDDWMGGSFLLAEAHLRDQNLVLEQGWGSTAGSINGALLAKYQKGKEIYERDGYCVTCHQGDGKGLVAAGFPPLAGTKWVMGNDERLIKITLQGMMGSIEVLGRQYDGQVPMTPFKGLLNDEEVAQVLTYVRNSFGNNASEITADQVKAVREQLENKTGFYNAKDLNAEYPEK